jgi:HEAT repeat protein
MMIKRHFLKVAMVAVVLLAAAGYLLTAREKQPPGQTGPIAPVSDTKEAAKTASQKQSSPTAPPQPAERQDPSKPAKPASAADNATETDPPDDFFVAEERKELVDQFYAYRENPTPEAIDTLIDYLDNADRVVADQALETLTYIARDGVEREAILDVLKAKSRDQSYGFRGKALYMATMVDPQEMLPIIGEYIDDPQENAQADSYDAAARALTVQIGPQSLPYVDALLTKSREPGVRRICFEILAKIDSPEAVAALEAQVQAAKGKDQTAGAAALARLEAPEVVDYLANSIQSGQFNRETIDRISYSPTAPEVFDRLLKSDTLEDGRKIELLDTLAEKSDNGSLQTREKMTDTMDSLIQETSNPAIKSRAIRVIGELGASNAPDVLETYLRDEATDVRKEAFYTFMDYTTPYNYEVLHDFLWDEDEQIRRTAMSSLARFAVEDDIEVLTKASTHKDEFIRKQAIALLDQLEGKE